ncbi:Mrp/NBP35 family ATP-binding protein [Rathayibacter soli]|uniref:Mrp/NBP35 family ATP-binding protein n=1 Tax=Rathayibacter soli TaxID=3144168 RepID=UPI0039080730
MAVIATQSVAHAAEEAERPYAYLEPRIHGALTQVIDPEIRRPITQLGMVSEISVDDTGAATVGIRLTIATCPNSKSIQQDVHDTVAKVAGVTAVTVLVTAMSPAEREKLVVKLRGEAATRGIQFGPDSPTRVYAVTSGKGGVGKSTITANLAVALAAKGLRVGLIDADVFGFSIPGLLGLVTANEDGVRSAQQPTRVDSMMLPPIAYGVKAISIGMFIEDDSVAVAWRGPMLHRTIKQFLTDVHFDELDILLLDLPPGTGDIAISVGQMLPHAEILVVTTPQPAAADVAERSGALARQTGQSVFGVIENMAGFAAPDGSMIDLFGSGGGSEVAARLSIGQEQPVPLLASVPLSLALREGGDAGMPVVLQHPDDPAAIALNAVADLMAARGARVPQAHAA